VLADAGALDSLVVTDAAEAAAIWRIREDGAGLAARTHDGRPAHAGWEDAAVPVEQLGALPARLRGSARDEHGLQGVPYATSATAACTCESTIPLGG
jgi:FAD/FMN-containing dehydrogenase